MIQINDKLRIKKADRMNLIVEQLRTIESEELGVHDEWCWCGYYGNLKSALLGVLHKSLFDSAEEELQLKDIIDRIEIAEKQIMEAKDE